MPTLRSEPLPQQSERFDQSDASFARDGLVAVRRASAALHEIAGTMTEADMRGPSLLDGWTRGHVVSHLARNADGLVNLLSWARTGIEHPMYASTVDREADIEEGTHRLAWVQQEDLWAAHQRFCQAADGLTPADWTAQVTDRRGEPITASLVPWMRLTEVLVHLYDLDLGADFQRVAELAGQQGESFVDYVVTRYENRTDVPAIRLSVKLLCGEERTWTLGDGPDVHDVHGPVAAVLAWLTGREVPAGLAGDVPRLPAWL